MRENDDVAIFFDVEHEKWACRVPLVLFRNMLDCEDEEKYANENLRMVFREIVGVVPQPEHGHMNFYIHDGYVYIWEHAGSVPQDLETIKELTNI